MTGTTLPAEVIERVKALTMVVGTTVWTVETVLETAWVVTKTLGVVKTVSLPLAVTAKLLAFRFCNHQMVGVELLVWPAGQVVVYEVVTSVT